MIISTMTKKIKKSEASKTYSKVDLKTKKNYIRSLTVDNLSIKEVNFIDFF